MKSALSLGLVDEEGDLFELEVKEPILFMHRVAPEVVPQNHVPIASETLVQKLLEVLCDLICWQKYLESVLVESQLRLRL